jgi:putative sterol carrier protein
MPELDASNLATLSPAEFGRIVRSTSDGDLRRIMAGPDRLPILGEIFGRMPAFFVPEKAKGVDARINLRVTGGPDDSSDTYAIVVKDGTCVIEKGPTVEPTVSLMLGPAELTRIVTKQGNPVMMVMTGKLKVRGDLGLAQRFSDFFEIPED